jgi:hypothetical protein
MRPSHQQRLLFDFGAIAQLGEHLHGMEGVNGSIPFSSTFSPIRERFAAEGLYAERDGKQAASRT